MVVDDDDDGGGGVVPHGRRCSLSDRGMAAMAESLQLALSLSSSIASVVGGRVASWPCCGVDDGWRSAQRKLAKNHENIVQSSKY